MGHAPLFARLRRRRQRSGGAVAWLALVAGTWLTLPSAAQDADAPLSAAPEAPAVSTLASDTPGTAALTGDSLVDRGRYLFDAALCAGCHTAEDGMALAGGRPIESPFGTFYTSNITPDPDHGIGDWSDEDFVRALSEGISPAGKHYYPAFPYTSFTKLTREDMLAIKAYLGTVEPVAQPNRPHDLVWFAGWRWPLGIWKAIYFESGTLSPDASRSETWNRGAYLSEAAAHCAECHSPRDLLGGIKQSERYAGADDGIEGGGTPNITPDKETGIGAWTADMLAFYLEIGMEPDGDFAGGAMAHVIEQGTGRLSAADRAAIAEYILSLPPISR